MRCVVSLFVILNLYLTVLGTDNSYNIVRWMVTEQYKAASSFDLPKTGVILINKPFHIILENYDPSLYSAGCKSKFLEQNFDTSFKSKQGNIIIQVNHVTGNMSTKWECWAWLPNNNKLQYFTFKIRIKGLERVRVTVGRLELNYTLTELSQVEYDGVAEYWYNDGEVVDLVCARHAGSIQQGYIRLTYYNAIDEMLRETNNIAFQNPVNFREAMHDENKNSYVDCTYTSTADIKYTYRTIFKLKSETTWLNEERMIIVGSAVVVSAVALVTVCFTIWCRLRRSKGVRQESCENVTRVLETPIPTYPSQWDTSEDNVNTQEDLMVTNSLYGVDCAPLYARPQKKTKRTAEPLYQSIEPVYNVPTSEVVDDVSVVNNVAKSVPQGVNLTYSNTRGDGEHSQLGNNKEAYDYVSSSNNSTRDYVEPLYSEVVWPQ